MEPERASAAQFSAGGAASGSLRACGRHWRATAARRGGERKTTQVQPWQTATSRRERKTTHPQATPATPRGRKREQPTRAWFCQTAPSAVLALAAVVRAGGGRLGGPHGGGDLRPSRLRRRRDRGVVGCAGRRQCAHAH